MTNKIFFTETIFQFINYFGDLYPNIEIDDQLIEQSVTFKSKKHKRIIIFYVWGTIEIKKYKQPIFYINTSLFNGRGNIIISSYFNKKYQFCLSDIMNFFTTTMGTEEEEKTYKEKIETNMSFMKKYLMPVLKGEMWIDELIRQNKVSE
jgi:fructose 1,6-bisphosphatase